MHCITAIDGCASAGLILSNSPPSGCRVSCFHPGVMDNFVMLSAGDLIDNTLGVKFGLATLTAAACGQVVRV